MLKPQKTFFTNSHFILFYCTGVPLIWIFSWMLLMTVFTDRREHFHYRKFSWEGLWGSESMQVIHTHGVFIAIICSVMLHLWICGTWMIYPGSTEVNRKVSAENFIDRLNSIFIENMSNTLFAPVTNTHKSISMFKNIKLYHPSMSVFCNCEPQIIWLLKIFITLDIKKKH